MGKYASKVKPPLNEAVILDDVSMSLIADKMDIPAIVDYYLSTNPAKGGLTIEEIKADVNIASAISQSHSNSNDHEPDGSVGLTQSQILIRQL
jgi:hypothetical protein